MKKCIICKEEHAPEKFYKNRKNKDGLDPRCKKCSNERKILNYRKNHPNPTKVYTLVSRELRLKGLKKCPACKEIKELTSFYKCGESVAAQCIICTQTLNLDRKRVYANNAYKKHKDRSRNARLKKKFGISLETYNEMVKKQNGCCAVCGQKEKIRGLAVDHCHKTGKVRELLCGRCNPAVGFVKDSPDLAKKIAEYLEKHSKEEL